MEKSKPIKDGIFTETPQGTRLQGNRCKECGQTFFPRVPLCLECAAEELEDLPLGNRGKLFTYSVINMPSANFKAPYAVGYVDLPEGVRIFTPLSMADSDSFSVGLDMELRAEPLWQEDDTDMIGFMAYKV
jgi:uncharacterized OB-fold protein